MSIKEMISQLARLKIPDRVQSVKKQLIARLEIINDLGLGYLELGRNTDAISSGECQRLRLASVIGSKTARMLYILDEPSAGLHAKDAKPLMKMLKNYAIKVIP